MHAPAPVETSLKRRESRTKGLGGFRKFANFATFFAAAKFHVSRVCLSLICAALHACVSTACPCTRGNEFEAPGKSHESGLRKFAKFAFFFAATKFHISRV